jgi:PAS domain S-box-containing protein
MTQRLHFSNSGQWRSAAAGIACLALTYVGAGALGLQFAAPPGYATIVWPPSGLGLAGLILYGQRLWPGIFVGSIILNAFVGSAFSIEGVNGEALAVAACIAAASTLQAVVASFAIRRSFGMPIRLHNYADLARFAVISGPVCCTIAALLGVATLLMSGRIGPEALVTNFLHWWFGDTFGVLLFLPIGLLNPWRPWSVQWAGHPMTGFSFTTLVLLTVPLFGTVVAWQAASRFSHSRSIDIFNALAQDNLYALSTRLNSYKQALDGGAGLVEASAGMTARQWGLYVEALKIKDLLPGISGLGFIEPVKESELASYIRKARAGDAPDFGIHPENVAPDNFIIRYIEPLESNKKALGLNIAFEKNRYNAALHARDAGRPTLTKRVILIQDRTESAGFLLLRPVYSADIGVLDTAEARQKALRGWVYAPFIASRFLNSLTAAQGRDFNLEIYDGQSKDASNLIFSTGHTGKPSAFRFEMQFPVMEQTWTLVWNSTSQYDAAAINRWPLIVLLSGLSLSFMFGALLLQFVRREETVRSLVTRKTAELAASEEQTRSIVDTALVGIMLLDQSGMIMSANLAAERIFARVSDDLIGKNQIEIMGNQVLMMNAPESMAVNPARYAIGRQLLEVQVNAWHTVMDELRYTLLIRDISTEEEAKRALTNAEQRWSAALEGASIGVFDIDLRTGRSVVSPAWKAMLGFDPNVGIDAQQEWTRRIHPDDRSVVQDADRSCLAGEQERSVSEYRIQRLDGDWIWVRSDAKVTERSADGTALRMIGTQTNITELRRTLDALKASEVRFRTTLQNAPVGMAMITPDRTLIEANGALCQLLGYERNELVGRQTQELVYSPDVDPNSRLFQDLAQGLIGSYQRELRLLHKSGRIIWVLVSVSISNDVHNGQKYFITQCQDVTDLKEMERLKSEFVATVSHELRTPLTSIRGSLGLVLGALGADLPANVTRLLNIAHSNCERLVLLINDILDMEKLSSGKMHFDIQKHRMSDLVQQAFLANIGFAEEHGVQQEIIPPLPDVVVNADAPRLHQVFANLLSNAVKFSPRGSLVTISAKVIAGGVHVFIRDQGPGIPPEFRSKIFGRFSQADSSLARSKGGTGLGLYISKQIMNRMSGTIDFESTPGSGSLFWLTLPLAEAQPSDHTRDAHRMDLPLILHLEDDRDFSEVVAAHLRDRARVANVSTNQEARSFLDREKVALVIIDIGLHNENGLEVLEMTSKKNIPAIILTAQESYTPDSRVTAYISKSRVTEDYIVETVLNALEVSLKD